MSSIAIIHPDGSRTYTSKHGAKGLVRRGRASWRGEDLWINPADSQPARQLGLRPVHLAYDRAVTDGRIADRRNLRGLPMLGDLDRLYRSSKC